MKTMFARAVALLVSVVLPIATSCRQRPEVRLHAERVIHLNSLVRSSEAHHSVRQTDGRCHPPND